MNEGDRCHEAVQRHALPGRQRDRSLRWIRARLTDGFETADLRAARGQIEAFQAGAST
jgi:hypothetical protein